MFLTNMKVEVACSTSPRHQDAVNNSSILERLYCMLSPKKPAKPAKPTPLLIPSTRPLTPSPEDRFEELKRVFHHFDEDGDGKISPTELQNCMRSVGEELSLEDVEDVVRSTDSDGDGLLGFEDFVELAKAEELGDEEKGKNLWEAFRVYEMEDEGCITPKSLRRALDRLGQSKTIEECTVMIRRFDINGDGVISFDEFKIMMML